MSGTRVRQGGCHCGAIRYEAKVPDPLKGGRCNCSICAMKGVVMVYVPLADLKVTRGADRLACYSFHTRVAKHHFCPACGIHIFHQGRTNPEAYGISGATLDGVDPYADFPDVNVHDGQHHAKDTGVSRSAGRLKFVPNDDP